MSTVKATVINATDALVFVKTKTMMFTVHTSNLEGLQELPAGTRLKGKELWVSVDENLKLTRASLSSLRPSR
jgi:hypothetical protein